MLETGVCGCFGLGSFAGTGLSVLWLLVVYARIAALRRVKAGKSLRVLYWSIVVVEILMAAPNAVCLCDVDRERTTSAWR